MPKYKIVSGAPAEKAPAQKYYTYDKIDATNANWRIVMSERSAGKTYGIKKKAIDNFLAAGKQFAYIRRLREEIELKRVGNYWDDIYPYLAQQVQKKFPHFKAVNIVARTGKWTVYGYYDEEMTSANKEEIGVIGYYFSLNQAQYDKSNSYPEVNMICFEEFIIQPGGYELKDEFTLFTNFISTIKRKRTDMVIYMIGNTINRNSQILKSMDINVRDLVQGEIKLYEYLNERGVANTVAVEWADPIEQSKESESFFVFNHQQEAAIYKGEWQTTNYPIFELDELYNADIREGLVLDDGECRLYAYLTKNKKGEPRMYVCQDRLINRVNYIELYPGVSMPRFSRFSYKSATPAIRRLLNYIRGMYSNQYIYFQDNYSGCDFDHFLRESR